MQKKTKEKLPLLIGVGLPLLLIVWILLFSYLLPKTFVKPNYNFIYVTGSNAQYTYVSHEKIQLDPYLYKKGDLTFLSGLEFYLYDVKNNENIPLGFDDTQSYKLDSSEKSLDGYLVHSKKDYSGDFFFFPLFWTSSSKQTYSISKNNILSKQISLKGNYYNFKFLGWVLNE